jgi:hypothetical protein
MKEFNQVTYSVVSIVLRGDCKMHIVYGSALLKVCEITNNN